MSVRIRKFLAPLLAACIPLSSVVTTVASQIGDVKFVPHTTDTFESTVTALARVEAPLHIVGYDPDLHEEHAETARVVGNLEGANPGSLVVVIPAREKRHAMITSTFVDGYLPGEVREIKKVTPGTEGILEADIAANIGRILEAAPASSTFTKASSGIAAMADASLLTGNVEQLMATAVPGLGNDPKKVEELAHAIAEGFGDSVVDAAERDIAIQFLLDGAIALHEDTHAEATEETWRALFSTIVDAVGPGKLARILIQTGLIVTSPEGFAHETVSTIQRKLTTLLVGVAAGSIVFAVTIASAGTLTTPAVAAVSAVMVGIAAEKAAELAFDVHDIITSLEYVTTPVGLTTRKEQNAARECLDSFLSAHPGNGIAYADTEYPKRAASAVLTTFLSVASLSNECADQLVRVDSFAFLSTPPTAINDEVILYTNAWGTSQSVVCDVLANDSDPDGGDVAAIEIVHAPSHGTVAINESDSTVVYTSAVRHGGHDSFTYRATEVPAALIDNMANWSNEATVNVRTVTPPAVVDLEVMGRPDLDTVSENYKGPWVMNFEASAPLLLSAIDLDAKSHEDYEFRVSPQPNGAPGVTMVSFGGVNTLGRLTCERLGCVYDDSEQRITMAGTATIKGPQHLLPVAGYLGMRFPFTVVDSDGHVSEPGTLTIMIFNTPPQGEAIQSRYISFRFGEPMIYPLEPSWYEAGCLSFTDPDGDPLTFRISQQPRKGRADLMKSGGGGDYDVTVMYYIDHDEAMLDHTDDVPFVDYLTVEAKDPFGATAETVVEITVDVINSNPVCVDDEVTTPMNTAVEFNVLWNDSDIDGDELTVIAVGVAGNGIASSVSDNTIRYVPNRDFYGNDTFTYTAEDGYGGSGTATVTVHVVDTEPPVYVSGPGDVGPLSNIAGTCAAVGKWTEPVSGTDVTDNIGLASLTCTHASGDTFPVGVTTVTYTATDLSGNTTDHTFTVTVVDDELPTIDGMPSDICVEVPVGVTETTVSWIEPTARDNCGIANLVSSHVPGDVFPLGKTSVITTATDIHGNTATDSVGVRVAEAWQLACQDKHVTTSNPSGTTVSFDEPVIGGCGVSVTFDPASGTFFDVGDTDVMCEVTDGVRTETCTFTVTVEFVNHDPVANGDVVDLKDSEIATEIEVLENDSDADGDDLTVIDVSTSSPCGEVWIDADGESVWFIGMYCQPYLGGTATFTYTVSDGNGGEDTATVRVDLPDTGTMPEVAEPPKDDR